MPEQREKSWVYIDANPFIYAVEGEEALAQQLKELFTRLHERELVAVTSELTLAEVLPKVPSPVHRRQYLNLLLWSRMIELRPITREILIETAAYRRAIAPQDQPGNAPAMPKLPDAIHVVTAIRNGCVRVLSADRRLKLPQGFRLFQTDSAGIAELISELP